MWLFWTADMLPDWTDQISDTETNGYEGYDSPKGTHHFFTFNNL